MYPTNDFEPIRTFNMLVQKRVIEKLASAGELDLLIDKSADAFIAKLKATKREVPVLREVLAPEAGAKQPRLSKNEKKAMGALLPILEAKPEGVPMKAFKPVLERLKIGNHHAFIGALVLKGVLAKSGARNFARYCLPEFYDPDEV